MGYEYEIGSTYGGMANLGELSTPVPAPARTFKPYSVRKPLGDGTVRGLGFAQATWRWGYLTQDQRDQLRTFCSGASAGVYIKTRKNDGTYQVYSAVMVWPDEEEFKNGKVLDFSIQFIQMQEYSP